MTGKTKQSHLLWKTLLKGVFSNHATVKQVAQNDQC